MKRIRTDLSLRQWMGISRGKFSSLKGIDTLVSNKLGLAHIATREFAVVSEAEITFELRRVEGILTEIKQKRSRLLEQDRELEQTQTTFKDVESRLREALAARWPKQAPEPSSTAHTPYPPSRRSIAMREGSQAHRIWTAISKMLDERDGPMHKDEIAQKLVELGLVPEQRRGGKVVTLLSRCKKAGLVNTDYHGNWSLPRAAHDVP